jgi:HlyD family secretion protein
MMTRTYIGVAALVAMMVGAYFIWNHVKGDRELPEGLIQANGRMEGDHITVASKFPGRVQALLAREGATVTAGQALVRLDDAQTRARVDQALHAVAAIEAQVEAAHTRLALFNLEVPLAIEQAQVHRRKAQASLDRALAVEREARSDAHRFRDLAAKDQASVQQRDQAEMKWAVAKKDVAVAHSAVAHAGKELEQAELGWRRINAQRAEVTALERQRDQADAAYAEADSILQDLTVTAPSKGTITMRMVDTGEVVAAGAPLLELVDLDRLYLQVYVPEVQIGKLRLGLPARIYTDAFPEQPYEAVLRYIASKAEFTPKEVQTRDERVKLIYAVKLYLTDNPDHRVTPGLPADAVIRWREEVAWQKPKW